MLKINMEFRKGVLFVRLYGILSSKTIDIFNAKVKEVIINSGIKYVVLNVGSLDYISPVGISEIKRLKRILNKTDGEFFLSGGSIKELKKLVNLENELKVFERVVI